MYIYISYICIPGAAGSGMKQSQRAPRNGVDGQGLEMPVKHAQAILNEISPKNRKKHARVLRCRAARKAPPALSLILPAL